MGPTCSPLDRSSRFRHCPPPRIFTSYILTFIQILFPLNWWCKIWSLWLCLMTKDWTTLTHKRYLLQWGDSQNITSYSWVIPNCFTVVMGRPIKPRPPISSCWCIQVGPTGRSVHSQEMLYRPSEINCWCFAKFVGATCQSHCRRRHKFLYRCVIEC